MLNGFYALGSRRSARPSPNGCEYDARGCQRTRIIDYVQFIILHSAHSTAQPKTRHEQRCERTLSTRRGADTAHGNASSSSSPALKRRREHTQDRETTHIPLCLYAHTFVPVSRAVLVFDKLNRVKTLSNTLRERQRQTHTYIHISQLPLSGDD